MAHEVVQRRGVPQAEQVAIRFGQESLGAPTFLPSFIQPIAKVAWVDRPAMGGLEVAALAANRSMIQLINPPGSGIDIYVKRLFVNLSAQGGFTLRTHNFNLTTLATTIAMMVRQRGATQFAPIGQIRSVQGAAVGGAFGSFGVLDDDPLELDFQIGDGQHFDGLVLQESRGILVAPDGDNLAIRATYHWVERQTG